MVRQNKKINSSIRGLNRPMSLPRRGFLLLFFIFCFSYYLKADISVSASIVAPEWNGKQLCDGGSGAVISPINAPSISISTDTNTVIPDDMLYDYVWEKSENNGMWYSVLEEKRTNTVPGFDPGLFSTKDASQGEFKISWRLRLRTSGGDEWFTCEEYSVRVVPGMTVNHTITPNENLKNIDLTVQGGKGGRTYLWTSLTPGIEIPKKQRKVEDPKGLPEGVFEVLIQDKCQIMKYRIDTRDQTGNNKTNQ